MNDSEYSLHFDFIIALHYQDLLYYVVSGYKTNIVLYSVHISGG